MSAFNQKILAVELCGDFSEKAARGVTEFSADPMNDFLEWGLSDNIFMCAVIALPQRALRIFKRINWPQVTVALDEAKDHRVLLKKSGNSGFELVFGTSADFDTTIQVIRKMGYEESGRTLCGSGEKHDPLAAAWNKVGLSNAIQIAARLSNGTICLFAHDADPLYILIKQN